MGLTQRQLELSRGPEKGSVQITPGVNLDVTINILTQRYTMYNLRIHLNLFIPASDPNFNLLR